MPEIKISASIRLIMAMFRLYAALEEGWGRAVKDILRKQYPDAKDEINKGISDQALGQKLLNIAMKQTQYNDTKAQDAIQNFLSYITTGTADFTSDLSEKGKKPTPFDFTKGSPTWEDALNNMYSNLRTRAMAYSQGYTKKEKKERSVDQAFGQRGEEGGAPEGGEGRMPTPEAGGGVGSIESLGQALDDKAGVKQFIDIIDEHIDDLKNYLPEDQRKLFELIFNDDIGSFGSDIKENMSQATALKEKYPDLFQKNAKRWSGFVGDLRKKLLESIWDYVDSHMNKHERDVLRDQFFSDTTPAEVRKQEKAKSGDKADYQRGLDERKLAKLKWQEQNGTLDDKGKAAMESLKKNMKDRYKDDLDLDAIPAVENPQAKGWTLHSKRAAFSLEAVSSRVAARFGRTGT